MSKMFWRDFNPASEARKDFERASWWRIYLPVAASALIAVGAAVVVLGVVPGDGLEQAGQLATIILAAGMLAAGFIAWLVILTCLWNLGDGLKILPAFTSRMRLRFVLIARSWKRHLHGVRRAAAAVSRFLSPEKEEAKEGWTPPVHGRRKGRER